MGQTRLEWPEPRRGSGLFVVFEGGEGAGKSTQSRLLAEALRSGGLDVVSTREPGGSPVGEAVRGLLLDPAHEGMSPQAEALLFAAARGEHVHRVVGPALRRGAVVICDRYVDSSVAYQGVARDLGVDTVAGLSLWATGGLLPDLTVLLDVDPSLGLSRAGRPDRLEAEPADFHAAVRRAYLDRAESDPRRYLVLDGRGEAPVIAEHILARVRELLAAAGGAQ